MLAVAFAKVGTGLVLLWQDQLTRRRRMILAAVAWFAVQAHSAALPFALAMFLWILWTQFRQGRRALQTALIEAAIVVFVLQIPAMFATESIRPTKIVAAMQEPQELRAGDAYRAVNDAVGSIGFAPFAVPQPTLILLAAVAAVLLIRGPLSAIGVVTIVPLALTVAMWSVWQQVYDAYVFLTIVPAALLAILWTTRLLPEPAARGLCRRGAPGRGDSDPAAAHRKRSACVPHERVRSARPRIAYDRRSRRAGARHRGSVSPSVERFGIPVHARRRPVSA